MSNGLVQEGRLATLRLPSGEIRLIPQNRLASVWRIGNTDANSKRLRKGRIYTLSRKTGPVANHATFGLRVGGTEKGPGGKHVCVSVSLLSRVWVNMW